MSRNANPRESMMNRKKKIPGKQVIILPPNFQEVLILQEIQISKNVNVDVIRKLVYLYSLGMEYYDSVNRGELQMFFTSKLNSLLTQPYVVEILDKNPINFKETSQLLNINLFGNNLETTYKTVPRKLSNHDLKSTADESSIPSRMKRNKTVADVRKRKNEEKEIETYIKEEVNNLNRKLNKMNEAICEDIIEQKSKFEEMKRKKKQTQAMNGKGKKCHMMKRISINSIQSQELIPSGKSSYKNIQIPCEYQNVAIAQTEAEPQRKDSQTKRRRESMIQTGMLKEIEEFVEKNMNEMYKALDELKLSFEDEIISSEKNGYPDIADSLREDMKVELENLKEQFEEQRLAETEKIRSKYQQNRGSFHNQ